MYTPVIVLTTLVTVLTTLLQCQLYTLDTVSAQKAVQAAAAAEEEVEIKVHARTPTQYDHLHL